jgi:hypothetical protein
MVASAASLINLLIVHTLADFQDNGRHETIIMIKWVKENVVTVKLLTKQWEDIGSDILVVVGEPLLCYRLLSVVVLFLLNNSSMCTYGSLCSPTTVYVLIEQPMYS